MGRRALITCGTWEPAVSWPRSTFARQQLLALSGMGLADLQAVVDTDTDILIEVVGTENAAEALQAACRTAIEQRASAEIDLAPPTE